MISISSLMGGSSSGSSISNMNAITGLASGLDTEAMIEGMVQSYSQKIVSLRQESTKLSWKQDAYQSISDKLVEFARKYTSYTSETNLSAGSFFTNSITTSTIGEFKDMISATGKSDSDITINSVKNLATAAKYTNKDSELLDGVSTTGSEVSLNNQVTVYDTSGTLKFSYHGTDYTIRFDENEDIFEEGNPGTIDQTKLVNLINKKLEGTDAEGAVTAEIDETTGALTLKGEDGKEVTLGEDSKAAFLNVNKIDDEVKINAVDMKGETKKGVEFLDGASFTVTYNGQTKTITLDNIKSNEDGTWPNADGKWPNAAVADALNEKLAEAFGDGKVTVSLKDLDSGTAGTAFSFDVAGTGNTFNISANDANMGEILFGDGKTNVGNYLDTTKTLGELGMWDGTGSFTINGVTFEGYNEDTSIKKIIDDINANTEVGVSVSYSNLTNSFTFTADETGEAGKIEIAEGDFAAKLFGATGTADADGKFISNGKVTAGTDATIIATINDQTMELKRSSNSFDIDGMTVKLEGTFNENATVSEVEKNPDEGVTFSTKTNTEPILEAIKSFVADFNAMATEIKEAYTTSPLKQTNGSRYEPLTEDQEADMSESEIEKWNEKAQTGLLYMDRDLSSLYSELRSAITPGGADTSYLKSIGIETSYEDGITTLTIDEEKLQTALENDLEGVKNAFTKSTENGADTNGLVASLAEVTDKYAATTGAVKGILIEKAGSQYSPAAALDNDILKDMEEIDEEIEKWQDKLSNKVDYYTNKFTQLELLINQMNSQSATLAGLTGGY